jgi:hypothetical protein
MLSRNPRRFAPALMFLGLIAAGAPALAADVAGTPVVSPFERPLSIAPERTLTYATLRFAVTKGVISNRVQENPQAEGKNPAMADVTLSVVNASKDAVRVENGQWQLKLADGTVYRQAYSDSVEPRNTREHRISFPVPMAAQWTGASLTLDEKDKEPATMSLDGPVSPLPFTIQLATGGEATTAGPAMKYTILAGSEDLEGTGERALLGKRYMHLSVRVTSTDGDTADQFLPEFFRISVDGAPYAPEHMSDNNIVASRGTQDVTMSLLIPATAMVVELEVGKPWIQPTIKIPLDRKPAKAS